MSACEHAGSVLDASGISSSSTRPWSLCTASSKGTNSRNAWAAETGDRRQPGPPLSSSPPCKASTYCLQVSLPNGRSLLYTASWVHRLLCSQHAVFTGKDSSQVAVFTVVCGHSVTCSQEHSFTGTQLHRNTASQEHSFTGTQLHRNTASQEHSFTVASQL